MPKRDELQTLERAVSDTIDEYLSRLHGIMSSWAFPDEFIEFLGDRGFCITEETRIKELEAELKQVNKMLREYVEEYSAQEAEIDQLEAELAKLKLDRNTYSCA